MNANSTDDDDRKLTQSERDRIADEARNIEAQLVVLRSIESKGVYWPGDDL